MVQRNDPRRRLIAIGMLALALSGGCRQLPAELDIKEEEEEEQQPVRITDFWGPHWFEGTYILGLAHSPGDTLFVSTWGKTDRIFRSTDLGGAWEDVSEAYFESHPLHVIHAESAERLFALYYTSVWGLVRSIDGGRTWENIFLYGDFNSMVSLDSGSYLVGTRVTGHGDGGVWLYDNDFADASEPRKIVETSLDRTYSINHMIRLRFGEILAGTALNGLYISRDNPMIFEPSELGVDSGYVLALAEDHRTGRVFAGATTGLYLSNDAGLSWHPTNFDITRYTPAKIVPAGPDTVFVLVHRTIPFRISDRTWRDNMGIVFTDDAGVTWGEIEDLQVKNVYDLFLTESKHLLATTNDGVYRSARTTDELYEAGLR